MGTNDATNLDGMTVHAVSGGTLRIRIGTGQRAEVSAREGRVAVNGMLTLMAAAAVRRIEVTGTAGPDRIDLSGVRQADFPSLETAVLRGEGGDDTILGSWAGDAITGGEGADTIDGRAGLDILVGGHGADRIHGGSGRDTLLGGEARIDSDGRLGRVSDDHMANTLTGGGAADTFVESGETRLGVTRTPDTFPDRRPSDTVIGTVNANPPRWLPPVMPTGYVKLGGEPGTPVPGHDRLWGRHVLNRYSTESAWNLDGTLLALRSEDPAPGLTFDLLIRGESFEPRPDDILLPDYPVGNWRWSQDPASPNCQWGFSVSGNATVPPNCVLAWDAMQTHLAPVRSHVSLDGPCRMSFGGKETVAYLPDRGHEFVAFLGESWSDRIHVLNLTLTWLTGRPVCAASGPVHWKPYRNGLTFSPDGRHVLLAYEAFGGLLWRLFDVDMDAGTVAPHPVPSVRTATEPRHVASASTAQGFFPLDWGHPVFALDARRGVHVVGGSGHWRNKAPATGHDDYLPHGADRRCGSLLSYSVSRRSFAALDPPDVATVAHVTGTAVLCPGKVWFTYAPTGGKNGNPATERQGEIWEATLPVRAGEAAANRRIGHHGSDHEGCYACEPHVAASQDGSRLVFASTMGPFQSVVRTYQADVRERPERWADGIYDIDGETE